jgi:hypothetical protein
MPDKDKNKGGRPKKSDGRNKVQVVLSNRAFKKFVSIRKGTRSQIVSDFLENI